MLWSIEWFTKHKAVLLQQQTEFTFEVHLIWKVHYYDGKRIEIKNNRMRYLIKIKI